MSLKIFSIVGVAAILTVSGCGSTSKTVEDHRMITDISGLVSDNDMGKTVLFVRPGVPTLADYNSFIIDRVRVDYSDPDLEKLDQNDLARVQRYFHERVVSELTDGGYKIVTKPGAGIMRISFTLSGIKVPNATANLVGILAPIALSVGEVTVEAAFRQSVLNRVDAVAVSRGQGSRVLNGKPWSTWADVESVFDDWAKGIRKAVDEGHGR